MSTINIEIQVDDPNDELTDEIIEQIISDCEEVVGKRNFYLYNSSFTRED